jgi:hypothetical protein
LPAREGKSLAVMGRYSYRETGRSLGEQSCEPAVPGLAQLNLVEDSSGPRSDGPLDFDSAALSAKFKAVRAHTELGKFRFGTPEYDRWAVIYGRVEARNGAEAAKAPANLVFRGEGMIVFLTTN